MLEHEEKKKFRIVCPRCRNDIDVNDFAWLGIFDDLSQFGKTVMRCHHCKRWFIIREEDEDGPFIVTC